ncbi:hypothetical protein SDC9_162415 [bioreactor metagenome]|uniref:Uncharacterized protein n=1 Tax=bioreactor metagenome TaxID=1076179 RepID=A0A645FN33_9ZZZZ
MLSPGSIFLELYTGNVFVTLTPTDKPFSIPNFFNSEIISTAISKCKSLSKSSFLIITSLYPKLSNIFLTLLYPNNVGLHFINVFIFLLRIKCFPISKTSSALHPCIVERVTVLVIFEEILSISSRLNFLNLLMFFFNTSKHSLNISVFFASFKLSIKSDIFLDFIPSRLYPTLILNMKSFTSDSPNSIAITCNNTDDLMYSHIASSTVNSVDHSTLYPTFLTSIHGFSIISCICFPSII